jgi:hypothetical protein
MSLAKFVSMLSTSSLYFSRLDQLGDPFEGSVAPANLPLREQFLPSVESAEGFSRFRKNACQYAFVNCWHMSEHESAAMWRLYAGADAGVAVRTDYQTLASVLPEGCFQGMVTYVDYMSGPIPEDNALTPYMYKRLSFAHEREVRALIWDIPTDEDGHSISPTHPEAGMLIPIHLDTLVHDVYVSPTAPEWYREAADDVARLYGLNAEIRKSSLDTDPTY